MESLDYNDRQQEYMEASVNLTNAQQVSALKGIDSTDKGLMEKQIELQEHIDMIDYLLRGYVLDRDDKGKVKYIAPKSNDMRVFTDYGVQRIINTIQFYLNKNTLLSNFTEAEILAKMKRFSHALKDNIFMEYDKIFLHPTTDDAYKVLEERVSEKAKLKQKVYQLIGQEIDIESLKKEQIEGMKDILEKEIDKIKQQLMKNKLKTYELIMIVIQDSVHSTYNRALHGMERKTIRQNSHVIYNETPRKEINNDGGGWGFLKSR